MHTAPRKVWIVSSILRARCQPMAMGAAMTRTAEIAAVTAWATFSFPISREATAATQSRGIRASAMRIGRRSTWEARRASHVAAASTNTTTTRPHV